jgi:hypothetical protein
MPLRDLFDTSAGLALPLLGVTLLALLVGCCEIGFRLGRRHGGKRRRDAEAPNIGTVTAGMLGLLAFTLSLSISMAQGRFDARRMLVVEEANAIGTAWLRAGLVEGPEGPALRRLLETWTQLRLEDTRATLAVTRSAAPDGRSNALQAEIWQHVETLARRAPTPITASIVVALNAVFDQALAQRFAHESRVPAEILLMLLAGSLLAIGALGYQLGIGGYRLPVLSMLLIIMWVGGMLLIVDLNRPREGNIRTDAGPLVWTLEGFGTPAPSR